MLSTLLFRDGDRVYLRNDLRVDNVYSMFDPASLRIRLNEDCFDAMTDIANDSPANDLEVSIVRVGLYSCLLYRVSEWAVCDEMFVEGHRVMKFLNP